MNKHEQLEFQEEVETYLERHSIHLLFTDMLKSLMVAQPSDPSQYLAKFLKQPSKRLVFFIDPCRVLEETLSSVIGDLQSPSGSKFSVLHPNEFLSKASLSAEDKKLLVRHQVIRDQSHYMHFAEEIKQTASRHDLIVHGFPQTLHHAVLLQEKKVIASKVIFVNMDDSQLYACADKFTQGLQGEKHQEAVEHFICQVNTHMRALKAFYKNCAQLSYSEQDLDNLPAQVTRCFEVNTLTRWPRRSSQVVIVGAPGSGRTTLAKNLAMRCRLVSVASSDLLANEIRNDSVTGNKVKDQFTNNTIIDNFTVEKLIEERISQIDCRMQGFVLEGYPKNAEQLKNLKESSRFNLTLIVAIDLPEDLSAVRVTQKANHQERYSSWTKFREEIQKSNAKVLWVNSKLSTDNMVETIVHELSRTV